VGLSAANTLLAFGLLGLSNTPALQAFGLTMLLGTLLVWLAVPCFGVSTPIKEKDNADAIGIS
jgi:predicted exporter